MQLMLKPPLLEPEVSMDWLLELMETASLSNSSRSRSCLRPTGSLEAVTSSQLITYLQELAPW